MGNAVPTLPKGNSANTLPKITKNPSFSNPNDVHQENLRRDIAVLKVMQTRSADQIRVMIRTSGANGNGVAPGTLIPIWEEYLIRPEDKMTFRGLMESYKNPFNNPNDTKKKIAALLAKGSDFIRATVSKAAQWVEIPPALVAVALQFENNLRDRGHHGLQTIERDLTTILDRLNLPGGGGSTGIGNVKMETLNTVVSNFKKYYKRPALPPGVPNVGRGQLVETDIYHVALVMRDCLNHTWSQGATSLRASEAGRYRYYPFFGGQLTKDDITRTVGRYNGFGDSAKGYGQGAANLITGSGQLIFLKK